MIRARSVSDGGAPPSLTLRARTVAVLGQEELIRTRSVSDGGAPPSLTLRARTVAVLGQEELIRTRSVSDGGAPRRSRSGLGQSLSSGRKNLIRAWSVSDGGGPPVAHAPGSDSRCPRAGRTDPNPERERRGGPTRRSRSGLGQSLSSGRKNLIRTRSVSDGGAHPSLTLRARTVAVLGQEELDPSPERERRGGPPSLTLRARTVAVFGQIIMHESYALG